MSVFKLIAPSQAVPSTSSITLIPVFRNSTSFYMEPISTINSFAPHNIQQPLKVQQYQTIGKTKIHKQAGSSHGLKPAALNGLEQQTRNNFLQKRDGWSEGHGKQSPAISALALLGFLFFLNLIQNSLINNRYLLTNGFGNRTNRTAAAAGRNGRVRQKRGLLQLHISPLNPSHLVRFESIPISNWPKTYYSPKKQNITELDIAQEFYGIRPMN